MNHIKKLSKKEMAQYIARLALYPLVLLFSKLGKAWRLFGTRKRQLTASILGVALIFTMLPALSPTVFAADPTPLTFTAQADDSSVTLAYESGDNVEYKLGNGAWTDYTKGTAITLTNVGDAVSFKGSAVVTDSGNHFAMTGTIAASGDVTSLTNGTGGDTALSDSCYAYMFFRCTGLTAAPALPATKLTDGCYAYMFDSCSDLTTAPTLPATTLGNNCYSHMFSFCTDLTAAPALPATKLTDGCYAYMFDGCSGLTVAPALPAATLAKGCYSSMFSGCTGLTAAPALNATELKKSCYSNMFDGCTGLTAAPALNATALADSCYEAMFQICTGLTTAPALPAAKVAEGCYKNMFYGCSSLKISATQTGPYTKEWRVPSTGSISETATDWNSGMLSRTGGTFKDNPTENTTYYINEDNTPPVISGIEDGKTYCITTEFTVTDAYPVKVTANGTELTAAGGKHTLTAVGSNIVVATDVAGNSTTVTVTLNANHTWDGGVVTKQPTAEEKGVKTYTCTICGETRTEEIDKLAPSVIEGNNGTYQQGSKDGLTFKSNASFADFLSVSVDGGDISNTNYTCKEGSTIVTLTADYLSNLSVGKHTLGINSSSGTASAEFTIVRKAVDPVNPRDNPKTGVASIPPTGDTSNDVVWTALLFLSGGALTALGVSAKRKKANGK